MEKSNGTTDKRSRFYGTRHAQLREWSWACLLLAAGLASHVVRNRAWKQKLASLPQAEVADLLCWMEQLPVPEFKPKWSAARQHRRPRESTFSRLPPKSHQDLKELVVDINTASATEWDALPGIGEVLSKRVVNYRAALGGFVSVDQVANVYGLDSAWVDDNRERLKVQAGSHEVLCLDSMTFKSLVRHPLFDADQTRKVLRAWGRGCKDVDAFWHRLAPTQEEKHAWEPYLVLCADSGNHL